MTSKGQVTIPKQVRDALRLAPGDAVEFEPNDRGEIVVRKAGARSSRRKRDRFDEVTGILKLGMSTDELMALLRGRE